MITNKLYFGKSVQIDDDNLHLVFSLIFGIHKNNDKLRDQFRGFCRVPHYVKRCDTEPGAHWLVLLFKQNI